jgi:hypothetical protein
VKCVADRFGPVLSKLTSLFGIQHCSIALDVVKRSEERQRLYGDLAAVVGMQIEELASRVRRTSDFSDVLLESGLVPTVVVAHQLALPASQEGASTFSCTAVGDSRKPRRAVH